MRSTHRSPAPENTCLLPGRTRGRGQSHLHPCPGLFLSPSSPLLALCKPPRDGARPTRPILAHPLSQGEKTKAQGGYILWLPKPLVAPVLNPLHAPFSRCCLRGDPFSCHSLPAKQPASQLLRIGKLRFREAPGLALSPRKPGHPSQRAPGTSLEASLPCHTPAWGHVIVGLLREQVRVHSPPSYRRSCWASEMRATCRRPHSQERADSEPVTMEGETEAPRGDSLVQGHAALRGLEPH